MSFVRHMQHRPSFSKSFLSCQCQQSCSLPADEGSSNQMWQTSGWDCRFSPHLTRIPPVAAPPWTSPHPPSAICPCAMSVMEKLTQQSLLGKTTLWSVYSSVSRKLLQTIALKLLALTVFVMNLQLLFALTVVELYHLRTALATIKIPMYSTQDSYSLLIQRFELRFVKILQHHGKLCDESLGYVADDTNW